MGSDSADPSFGGVNASPASSTPLRIYVLIGPPSSGKTTCARWLAKIVKRKRGQELSVLSSDEFRTQRESQSGNWFPAFDRVHKAAVNMLKQRRWIALDACNLMGRQRWGRVDDLLKAFSEENIETIALVMQTRWEDCIAAEARRPDRRDAHHRASVIGMIRRMWNQGIFDPPWWLRLYSEPWTHIFKMSWNTWDPTKEPYIVEKVR